MLKSTFVFTAVLLFASTLASEAFETVDLIPGVPTTVVFGNATSGEDPQLAWVGSSGFVIAVSGASAPMSGEFFVSNSEFQRGILDVVPVELTTSTDQAVMFTSPCVGNLKQDYDTPHARARLELDSAPEQGVALTFLLLEAPTEFGLLPYLDQTSNVTIPTCVPEWGVWFTPDTGASPLYNWEYRAPDSEQPSGMTRVAMRDAWCAERIWMDLPATVGGQLAVSEGLALTWNGHSPSGPSCELVTYVQDVVLYVVDPSPTDPVSPSGLVGLSMIAAAVVVVLAACVFVGVASGRSRRYGGAAMGAGAIPPSHRPVWSIFNGYQPLNAQPLGPAGTYQPPAAPPMGFDEKGDPVSAPPAYEAAVVPRGQPAPPPPK